jgi:hypothetical protein
VVRARFGHRDPVHFPTLHHRLPPSRNLETGGMLRLYTRFLAYSTAMAAEAISTRISTAVATIDTCQKRVYSQECLDWRQKPGETEPRNTRRNDER